MKSKNNKKNNPKIFFNSPSFYSSNARFELFKFIVGSIIVSIFSYIIFSYLPKDFLNDDFLNILLALLFGNLLSFWAFTYFHYNEKQLAFQYLHRFLPRWKDILIKKRKKIYEIIQNEYNSLLFDIVRLPNEAIKSTYTNQIKIASIFNRLAKEKFWATSFDLPSQFYAKNSDYFLSMNNTSSEITNFNKEINIPNKARIFICPLDEFIEDIYHNPKKFKELIEWHLQWHKKTNVTKENSPIRFYFYKDSKQDILDKFFKEINPEYIIPDFMLVDNKLVYGRIENKTIYDNNVTLRSLTKKDSIKNNISNEIESYEKIFKNIYESSIEPINVIDLLNYNLISFSEQMKRIDEDMTLKKHQSFSGQYYRLDAEIIKGVKEFISKELKEKIDNYNKLQNINNHYGNLFINKNNFTKGWLDLMESSNNTCVAVDTADSRGGSSRFLDKWNEDPLYKEFLSSSYKATKNGAIFKRVFILDDKINSDERDRFILFLSECVNNSLEVGIVLLNTLINKGIIKDDDIHSNTDFILLNIDRTKKSKQNYFISDKNIYGFRITKGDDFIAEKLNYENNLVDPNDFYKFYKIFEKIYSISTKFSSYSDIQDNNKISLFIKKNNKN